MEREPRKTYDHAEIESSLQKEWAEAGIYESDLTKTEDPYYLLFEFPYPSGDLHMGHWYAFAVGDIYARMLRLRGKNVLFPIGFDAFGLPAENAAMKNGADPKEWTYANMEKMRGQFRQMGTSVDWSKEVVTCSPEYYKWTQWLFARFFEHNLAERKNASVKWCPKDKTVLANEQVIDGKCERCDTPVEEKHLTQWFLKITDYADRLVQDLDTLPWPEEIKTAQREWIGKSEGAEITFAVSKTDTEEELGSFNVFTTRPDTLFGVTYVVLAPEHALLQTLPFTNKEEVAAYLEETKKKTELERKENKEKSGVCLEGITATNPVNGEKIPVYVADYVLGSYGTGAVMAVPAHDERDFEFAARYQLPMRYVIAPTMVDTENPPVEDKETVTRNNILAIVRNPKTNLYLALRWKHQPWTTFITGGVDLGEDPIEAAKREVLEETGYKNIKLVRVLGGPVRAEFFASHKDENRIAYNTNILFDLIDEETEAIGEAELAQHEPAWLTLEEIVAEKMRHAEIELLVSRIEKGESPYTGAGTLVNSGEFTGRNNEEVFSDIIEFAKGAKTTNYRLRDWLVSRQRYWGCPIPVVYDPEGKPHLIPAEHLPWLLPTDVDFTPSDKAPLASSKELHERVTTLFGEGWTPEYDTLDTFVDSSWYYLRYLSPNNEDAFSDASLMKKWLPIDRYSGGAEHVTMHLLYSRFFNKALYDLALVPTSEPFNERFNRGLIMGPDGRKMSKRWGNVINPDEYVQKYGADAVRLYLAFIAPYNETGSYPWGLSGVESMRKFLNRVYALKDTLVETETSDALLRSIAKTAVKVAGDGDKYKLNTAVSALMILLREIEAVPETPREAYKAFLLLLAPFAPHLAEHIWKEIGEEGSIHTQSWPVYDEALLVDETVPVVVQINGKRKGEIALSPTAEEADALEAAKTIETVAAAFATSTPARIVYVPGRILNIVL